MTQIWILVDVEKCSGCRLCEFACSLKHEGVVWPEASRIKVFEYAPAIIVPHLCRQCPDYPCVKACPTEALSVDESTGAVIVDAGRCVLCRRCIEACPARVPRIIKGKSHVLICDLCGGEPECVKVCQDAGYNALKVVPRPGPGSIVPQVVPPDLQALGLAEKIYKTHSREVV